MGLFLFLPCLSGPLPPPCLCLAPEKSPLPPPFQTIFCRPFPRGIRKDCLKCKKKENPPLFIYFPKVELFPLEFFCQHCNPRKSGMIESLSPHNQQDKAPPLNLFFGGCFPHLPISVFVFIFLLPNQLLFMDLFYRDHRKRPPFSQVNALRRFFVFFLTKLPVTVVFCTAYFTLFRQKTSPPPPCPLLLETKPPVFFSHTCPLLYL